MSLTRPMCAIEGMSSSKSQVRLVISYIWRQVSVSKLCPRTRPGALAVTPHGVSYNLETPQEANCCYRLTTVPVRLSGPYSKQDRSLALGSGVHCIERISRGYCRRKCNVASYQARFVYGRVRTDDQGPKAFLYTPFFVANIAVTSTDLSILSRLRLRNLHNLPFPQWLPP